MEDILLAKQRVLRINKSAGDLVNNRMIFYHAPSFRFDPYHTDQRRGTGLQSQMKDMEVGGPEGQHHPRLHSKSEVSLGYKRLSKEIRKKGRGGERREERKEQMKKETCNEMGKQKWKFPVYMGKRRCDANT